MNSEKKLKLILASLKDREIIKFFDVFSAHFSGCLKNTIRQISFNCYESVCEFKNKIVSGYGKNSNQAYINSIRTLLELLADDTKMHNILKQSMMLINSTSCDSDQSKSNKQKSKTHSLHASVKPASKKQTLKQQIFQYLNLDNLKISNPNTSHKTKMHEKYLNQSVTEEQELEQILKRNQFLEKQIMEARAENQKLKSQLREKDAYGRRDKSKEKQGMKIENTNLNNENTKSKSTIKDLILSKKTRDSFEPLKTRTNDYLNMSQDTRLRSISVQASSALHGPQSQTQKYSIQKTGERLSKQKKVNIPKLNLQVLPNYHGKSNKSLNQSLMQIYEKAHK